MTDEQQTNPEVAAQPAVANPVPAMTEPAPELAGDVPDIAFAEVEPEPMESMIDEIRRDVHGIYTILEHFENEFFKPKPVRQRRRRSTNGRRTTNARRTRNRK